MRLPMILAALFALRATAACASGPTQYLDHQFYKADVKETVEAVKSSLKDIGLDVLGDDASSRIVVSRPKEVGEAEKDVVADYEKGGMFYVILVAYVVSSGQDEVEVDITTLVHGKNAKGGRLMERGFVWGNSLTEQV